MTHSTFSALGTVPATLAAITALIALALGAMQARAQILIYALSEPNERGQIASFTNLVTLAAWFINLAWVITQWPWYASMLALLLALGCGSWVRSHTVPLWASLRYVIAMATLASAGLLWTVFRARPLP